MQCSIGRLFPHQVPGTSTCASTARSVVLSIHALVDLYYSPSSLSRKNATPRHLLRPRRKHQRWSHLVCLCKSDICGTWTIASLRSSAHESSCLMDDLAGMPLQCHSALQWQTQPGRRIQLDGPELDAVLGGATPSSLPDQSHSAHPQYQKAGSSPT